MGEMDKLVDDISEGAYILTLYTFLSAGTMVLVKCLLPALLCLMIRTSLTPLQARVTIGFMRRGSRNLIVTRQPQTASCAKLSRFFEPHSEKGRKEPSITSHLMSFD